MFSAQNSQVASSAANYIEDVFSTYLYTGTGATRTITNGIDLLGKGGLVWFKHRNQLINHALYDTARGATKSLFTNATDAQFTVSDTLTAFTSSGFTLGADAGYNYVNNNGFAGNTNNYASWTFRKQAKFFDIVTWTGDGTNPRTINHNLGSTPGCIIIKCTSSGVADWPVWHRSLPTEGGFLNTIDNFSSGFSYFGSTVTSTTFSLNSANVRTNQSGATYVAYLFAHDAGGFGATGTDNVISCGSFTQSSAADVAVSLGYEPQWVLVKQSNTTGQWNLLDDMRGFLAGNNSVTSKVLRPNLSNAEADFTIQKTATGFTWPAGQFSVSAGTYIYIAIRRGPMKTPTSGTSVFSPVTRTGTGAIANVNCGFAPDMVGMAEYPAAIQTGQKGFTDKLRGGTQIVYSSSNIQELASGDITQFQNNGVTLRASGGDYNVINALYINWFFQRAPGFFDIVCYTGTGSATTFNHNLTVVPELMIVKSRNNATNWAVYCAYLGGANPANRYVLLNSSNGFGGTAVYWNDTAPTSTVFTVGTTAATNTSSYTYVAYLFATVAGVSKVGSYTGNGSSQTINCGFAAGARFILIKRTDSTGNWVTFDTARGIVSGNDPALYLNSTAAEVTGIDAIDPDNSGFIVNQETTFNLNVNAATYIYLSIS